MAATSVWTNYYGLDRIEIIDPQAIYYPNQPIRFRVTGSYAAAPFLGDNHTDHADSLYCVFYSGSYFNQATAKVGLYSYDGRGAANSQTTIQINTVVTLKFQKAGYYTLYASYNNVYWHKDEDGWDIDTGGSATTGYNQQKELLITVAPAPSIPVITVPTMVVRQSASISWTASSVSAGSVSAYQLQRSVNDGAWVDLYRGASRQYTDTPETVWQTVQYRVKAISGYLSESAYSVSDRIVVIHNIAPVISGSDTALGVFGMSMPAYTYTVTDADGDKVTVTETLDGTTLRTYTPALGEANTVALSADRWMQVLNGSHAVAITADDGNGGTASRTLTFTKNVGRIEFYLSPPLAASDMATKAIESVIRQIPTGAMFVVEVCNNANDPAPAWEDVTQRVIENKKIFFENTSKTAADWAYNIRVSVDRGNAAGECWVSGGSGFFE